MVCIGWGRARCMSLWSLAFTLSQPLEMPHHMLGSVLCHIWRPLDSHKDSAPGELRSPKRDAGSAQGTDKCKCQKWAGKMQLSLWEAGSSPHSVPKSVSYLFVCGPCASSCLLEVISWWLTIPDSEPVRCALVLRCMVRVWRQPEALLTVGPGSAVFCDLKLVDSIDKGSMDTEGKLYII